MAVQIAVSGKRYHVQYTPAVELGDTVKAGYWAVWNKIGFTSQRTLQEAIELNNRFKY